MRALPHVRVADYPGQGVGGALEARHRNAQAVVGLNTSGPGRLQAYGRLRTCALIRADRAIVRSCDRAPA